MPEPRLDQLYIRDLLVRCIIGIYPDERREKQDVILNITMHADLSKACKSDDISDTVDYKTIKKDVLAMALESEFFLIERLADRAAQIALDDPAVQRVDVTVDKPGALRFAKSVAVSISRTRADHSDAKG